MTVRARYAMQTALTGLQDQEQMHDEMASCAIPSCIALRPEAVTSHRA